MTYLTSGKSFLQRKWYNLIALILNKETLHFFMLIFDVLHHFCDLNSTNYGVGARNGWNNVACHIFDFIKSLFFNAKAMHSQVCSTRNKMDDIVVIFLKGNHSFL